MRWLVRFGYDGSAFCGWARQPGLRTVEGEILRGLVRRDIVATAARAALEVASRTDRGVSAVGNAIALTTDRSGSILLRALNGISPEVFFSAATPLPEGYRPRAAVRRVYRYFEPIGDHDPDRWRETARLFAGRVDVRSLGRGIPTAVPVLRPIESVRVEVRDAMLVVEVRAPSFVWGEVRKIVGALREVDRSALDSARLAEALEGQGRLTLPMAEPERLLLWDVEYPFPWEVSGEAPNRHQSRWLESVQNGLAVRAEMLREFAAARGGARRPEPSLRT